MPAIPIVEILARSVSVVASAPVAWPCTNAWVANDVIFTPVKAIDAAPVSAVPCIFWAVAFVAVIATPEPPSSKFLATGLTDTDSPED